jgi:hypothetical protein
VVFGRASVSAVGTWGKKDPNKDPNLEELERMFQSMIQQASRMGADAIIDIKMTTAGGEYPVVVAIGTAVKLR